MTVPIPTEIVIGHVTYTVTVDQGALDAEALNMKSRLSGVSNATKQTIILAEGMPHEYAREVLIHEILHQCLRVTGIDPDADGKAGLADVEERAVTSMAGPLYGVLRDNPKLLTYITDTK